MFEKSGERIKKVSQIIFYIILVIAFIVTLFALFNLISYQGGIIVAIPLLITVIIIVILNWISLLFLYAFGDLVDSNEHILELLQRKQKNPLVELLKLYQDGILTKEEFDAQKNLLINKDLNSIAELIDIKEGYEKGLLSEEEYLEIKKDVLIELNQQNKRVTYKIRFDDVRIGKFGSLKIIASNNATKKELVKIVRKMGYDDGMIYDIKKL